MDHSLTAVLVFLFFLQVKHVFVDFVLQDMEQVRGKGIYGNFAGFTHSLDHAIGTVLILLGYHFAFGKQLPPSLFVVLPLIDLATHYHIDWCKMNLGCRDMMNEKFWHHLGYDQFAHQMVYLVLTYLMFNQ